MIPANVFRRKLHALKNQGETRIHAGLHKTGSTSLQNSLRVAGILQSSSRSDFRDPVKFQATLSEAGSHNRVVSSEHLLAEMYDMYSTAPERIELITNYVERSEITLYLKPHPEWHASAYSQLVQQGTLTDCVAYQERVESSRYFSWSRLARDLLNAGGSSTRIRVRAAQNVVRDYAKVLRVPLPRSTRKNSSLSPMALEALVRLGQETSIPWEVARRGLQNFMPESRLTTSVLSREFQSRLLEMREDWLQLTGIINAETQVISGSWETSYLQGIRAPARDIFSGRDLKAAEEHIRLVIPDWQKTRG